jgi:hypothetical protein
MGDSAKLHGHLEGFHRRLCALEASVSERVLTRRQAELVRHTMELWVFNALHPDVNHDQCVRDYAIGNQDEMRGLSASDPRVVGEIRAIATEVVEQDWESISSLGRFSKPHFIADALGMLHYILPGM